MDRSFRRGEERDVDREWQKEALDLVLLEWPEGDPSLVERPEREDQTRSVRGTLLRALVRDDPAFRERFVELAVELMNHAWNTAFFVERMEYYADYHQAGGIDMGEFLRVVRFVRRRHEFLRDDFARVFELEPAFPVEVRAHEGVELVVDGHATSPPYSGWYFKGQRLRVQARCSEPSREAVLFVGGQERGRAELDLLLQGSIDVLVSSRPSRP